MADKDLPAVAALTAIGAMFGISRRDIRKARPFLSDFPKGKEQTNGATHYNIQAVKAWAEGKDVKALVKEALAAERRGEKPANDGASMLANLAKRMIAGEFAAAEQKQRYAMKKLVARHCRRQPVHRITVRPDWME